MEAVFPNGRGHKIDLGPLLRCTVWRYVPSAKWLAGPVRPHPRKPGVAGCLPLEPRWRAVPVVRPA
jgi:hypothetical protein